MKYAIYGINRVAKDFIYIFDTLEITCFFEETNQTSFLGKMVYPIDKVKEYSEKWEQIIICDFEKEERRKKLEEIGLIYKQDFIFEEDIFYKLNKIEINPLGKEIVVWGTGKRAESFREWNQTYNVKFYIDSYKNHDSFYDIPVKKVCEIQTWKNLFVIIAVADDAEIKAILQKKGLYEYNDFCNSQELIGIPSNLLRKTIFDKNYYDFRCNTILNHAEIMVGGGIFCCCTTYLDISIGSIEKNSFFDIWNGYIHKILALSSQNGTYTFCKKSMCPFFVNGRQKRNKLLEHKYYHIENTPSTVALGFDNTCNLQCITCREKIHIACGKELEKINKYAEIIKKDLLPNCEFLILAGNGEVFASQTYKKIYMSPNTQNISWIRLLSNGTLLNKKTWEEFKKNKRGKIMLTVSIDAYTKDTYSKIRKNGNFENLQNNMLFASHLRRKGELSYLRFNFVVQRDNYQEMIPFIKWGLKLGVDEIFFTKILNWGTYTQEEFKDISMMEEDGVTPKKELEEILNDPIMNNSIVDLGTIYYSSRVLTDMGQIQNYYRWELERKVPQLFDK